MGSVARADHGRLLCPEFMSIRCKQGTCSMFCVPPLPCVWAQQSSRSHSASSIPSYVKPTLPVLLPFWSKDDPSPPSLNKHHTTEPRDRSLALCLFVSHASEICLRPGIPYTMFSFYIWRHSNNRNIIEGMWKINIFNGIPKTGE